MIPLPSILHTNKGTTTPWMKTPSHLGQYARAEDTGEIIFWAHPEDTDKPVRSLWRDQYALAGNRYGAALARAERADIEEAGGGELHRIAWVLAHQLQRAWVRLTRPIGCGIPVGPGAYPTKRLGRRSCDLQTIHERETHHRHHLASNGRRGLDHSAGARAMWGAIFSDLTPARVRYRNKGVEMPFPE